MVVLSKVLEGVEFLPGTKKVSELLSSGLLSSPVSIVSDNSRRMKPGGVFIALKGAAADGHLYAADAVSRGAVLVIAEKELPELGSRVPVLLVSDGRDAVALAAANFHETPSRGMKVVGITGTSGKTTTSYLVESILRQAGHRVGVIGTVSIRYPGKEVEAAQTTPGAADLQELFAEMRQAGCTAVVMEVSSHALAQKRVAQISFDAAVFTNLSPEHQDYHAGMEDYFRAKALLFTERLNDARRAGKNPIAVINGDDPYGRRLEAETNAPVISFRFSGEQDWTLTVDGITGRTRGERFTSPLIGRFNGENILAALGAAEALGIAPETAARGISLCPAVPGRLERVPNKKGLHIFVDYAHKPDALDKVLQTLKDALETTPKGQARGRLITVFGCGGDRDRTKRPVMGRLAAERSDLVWVTSDNPRTEDPSRIIQEIVAGMGSHQNFRIQPDRKAAIEEALSAAGPGDLVLIAGKGHETYQILPDPTAPGGTRKIPFDDRKIAASAVT